MEKINFSSTAKKLKEKLREQRKPEILANLKRNWYFPISAMAFFCLSATLSLGYIIGLLFAFVISLVVSSQIPSIFVYVKKNHIGLHIVSILTAVGICLSAQTDFYAAPKMKALGEMLPIPFDVPMVMSVLGAIAAVFFVYFCILLFWNAMIKIFSETGVFCDIKISEWIIYGVLLIASVGFMSFSFAQTEAFYGTEYSYDIIYTSDSPNLVKENVYLALTHPENDIRQPLFAVFAAPFTGIFYLFGRLSGATASVQAMLLNSVQVIMLFAANFMLTKMMKLNSLKRVCFMLVTSFTYTQLLFTLMMEQYIIAYFWLILCMYLISEKQQPDRIALWGAGGTLLTSLILLPFMSDKSPIKKFKEWFIDMLKYGFEFVILMVAFCRFDVIFNLRERISLLIGFTGRDITVLDKIFQYTEFIHNCFMPPDAGVNTTAYDYISWQLNTATGINTIGIIIFILAAISAVLNRDIKSSRLAAGWACFSIVILIGLGWGSKENGLILYSLYFGWAFFVLLFQLIEKIENKLKVRFIIPIVSVLGAIALALINIPAITEMVNFGITYFPVRG